MKKIYSLFLTMLLAFVSAGSAWAQLSLEDGAKYYLKYGTKYIVKAGSGYADVSDDASDAVKFSITNTGMGYTFEGEEIGSLAMDGGDCVFGETPEYYIITGNNSAFSMQYFNLINYKDYYLTYNGYLDGYGDEDTSWNIEKADGISSEITYTYCLLLNSENQTYKAAPNMQDGQLASGGYSLGFEDSNNANYINVWIAETSDNSKYKFRHANSGKYLLVRDLYGITEITLDDNGTKFENTNASNDGSISILVDGTPFFVDPITEVRYTLNDSGFGTLCLPFNFSVGSGLTANVVTGSGDVLNVVPVNGNLKAKEGYIMVGTPGETYTLTIQDEADANPDNILSGTTCREIGLTAGEFYGLKTTAGQNGNRGGAVFAKSTTTAVPANKAYLLASKLATSSNSLLSLSFDVNEGELTNIHEICNIKSDSPVYDLQGRRVSANAHGLLIQNGKKVFNK